MGDHPGGGGSSILEGDRGRRLGAFAAQGLAAVLLVAGSLVTSGCGSGAPEIPAGGVDGAGGEGGSVVAPAETDLLNGTFWGIYEEPVTLRDGWYAGPPFMPDGHSRPTLSLLRDRTAWGDLDADGDPEAAVLLAESSGGSGSFVYLAAVDAGGRPRGPAVLIGDRIEVMHVEVVSGRIVVSCRENRPVVNTSSERAAITRHWKLEDDMLVEQKILFTLDSLDENGLVGSGDGRRSLAYEFCLPDRTDLREEVRALDPSAAFFDNAPGRAECDDDEVLVIGETGQPGYREVLHELAARPYISRISQAFFE